SPLSLHAALPISPRVAARLRALGDHDVAAGGDRLDGVADLAAHVDDDEAVLVAQVDDVAGDTEAGDEGGGAPGDDVADLGLEVAGHGGQQVDAERLVGRLPHRGH